MTLPKPSKKVHGAQCTGHGDRCRLALFSLLALATLASCDNGCEQTRESYAHLAFTSTSGRQLQSITMTCRSGERAYQSTLTSFTSVEVDLNPHDTLTTIILDCTYVDYGDTYTVTDSIRVHYATEPKFLDLACGCSVLYTITDLDTYGHFFPLIDLTDPDVTTESGINITCQY